MVKQRPQPPTPPVTRKNKPDDVHWCGHKIKDHNGPDGMCKFNTEADGCDCGGIGDE